MIPYEVNTLFINGYEVRVRPVSVDAQVMKYPKNIVKLPCGPVEIKWPGQEVSTLTININYANLDEEDAEAILVLSTMNAEEGGSISFGGHEAYSVQVLKCELTEGDRGWEVHLTGVITQVAL